MKKNKLIFALSFAIVSAAFSQEITNCPKDEKVQPTTNSNSIQQKFVTYDYFMRNRYQFKDKFVTLTDAIVDASTVATQEMKCSHSSSQVKVQITSRSITKTQSSICFIGDKKIFYNSTKMGKLKLNANVTIFGNDEVGYIISNPKFSTVAK